MDDGSGKCLLDVISDPSALSEFLRSNSQLLLDGEDLSSTKNRAIQVSDAGQKSISHSIANTSPISSSINVPTSILGQQTNRKFSKAALNNSSGQSPFRNNTKASVMSNVSRTFSQVAKPAAVNIPVSTMASSSKGISTGGTFQSKKPIPIQPKNQVIRPNTTIPVGMTAHSNARQTTPVINQLPMAQSTVRPKSNVPLSVNGTEKARISQYQALQANRTAQSSAQSILTTPPKRIAPKQVLSPPLNPALTITSPMRLTQTNVMNKQVQLPAHLLQAPTTQGAQSQSQLYPQQITSMVRQIAPSNQVTSVQSLPAKPIQHVQQIQQLVQEKLGVQQPTQPQGSHIQQKVFTQAQLQAALKQSQLLAQNSPGQQQNLLVQQQILKQLIQQVQLAQQQNQSEKVQVNVQPSIMQLQQQPIAQTIGQTVPNANVTMANQIAVSNQQIQMVSPNQRVVAVAQNTLPSNQQTLNVGQNVTNLNQQSLKTLNVNNKQIPVGSSQANASVSQPMMIVSQGNILVQQNGPPLSTGATTTAGNSKYSGVQLQNLINQQQQQTKVVSNIQQVSQAKQVNQNSPVFVQNVMGTQGQTVNSQQVGSPQPVTQQNFILQSKQSLTPSQGTNTTIQQLTPAQVQQLQNLGAVQKVFIIRQPEVLQKLGVQGAKQTQTIQITPQQLQALQQMQNQQQPNQQTIIIQNNTPGGSKTATTVLSAQQVKQLHTIQQQAGKTPQSPQTLIQRQALVQQIQKQLSSQQTPKTQTKMAHVPRILQTSGRQPVTTSQVSSKIATTVKQEPNRGTKRSHPETQEPPKVVTRLKSALYQDQQVVTHPDIHTPFKSRIDAINKLRTYHVYHDPDQTPKDIEKSEGLFNTVADQLIKRSEKMINKYRTLMLEESLRKEPSSEMVMLYRLYLADERAALAQDKKQIAEDLKALKNMVKIEVPTETMSTNAPQTTVVKQEQVAKIKQEPQPKGFKVPLPVKDSTENTENELDILNTSIAMDSLEDDILQTSEDDFSDMEHEPSEIDKAVFNMETSSSVYFEPANHTSDLLLTDKSVDGPRTSVDNTEAEDCIAALPMDDADDAEDETEKEDVTATLALLHSMAEELADIS